MISTMLVAMAVTAVLLVLLRPLLERLDLVDVPNERSSHSSPVLRGGGLAIAVGTSVGLVVADVIDGSESFVLLLVPACLALVGFADDHKSQPVLLRLMAQVLFAGIAAATLARGFEFDPALVVVAVVATVVWIVGFVNIFNFMDGINGISAATATIVGVMHMIVGAQLDVDLLSVAGAALAGGALGFMPFNYPVARIFAGDVGSYFLGSYIAILSVIALVEGASIVTVAAPVMLYVLDTSYTLVRRAVSGKSIFTPHREHSYQYLANNYLSHVRATMVVALLTATCATLGLLAEDRPVAYVAACGAAVLLLSAMFVLLPKILIDRRALAQAERVPETARG